MVKFPNVEAGLHTLWGPLHRTVKSAGNIPGLQITRQMLVFLGTPQTSYLKVTSFGQLGGSVR